MPYPPNPSPDGEIRKTFGLSLEPELARRIDALAGFKRGRRSQFICDTLEIGLERRFGPNWQTLADEKIEAIEREAIPA